VAHYTQDALFYDVAEWGAAWMRSLRRESESWDAQSAINLGTWKEAPGYVDSTSRRPSGNCECQAAGLARLAHKVGFICFKSRVSRAASSIRRWRRGRLRNRSHCLSARSLSYSIAQMSLLCESDGGFHVDGVCVGGPNQYFRRFPCLLCATDDRSRCPCLIVATLGLEWSLA
jgi:hypothetical protein